MALRRRRNQGGGRRRRSQQQRRAPQPGQGPRSERPERFTNPTARNAANRGSKMGGFRRVPQPLPPNPDKGNQGPRGPGQPPANQPQYAAPTGMPQEAGYHYDNGEWKFDPRLAALGITDAGRGWQGYSGGYGRGMDISGMDPSELEGAKMNRQSYRDALRQQGLLDNFQKMRRNQGMRGAGSFDDALLAFADRRVNKGREADGAYVTGYGNYDDEGPGGRGQAINAGQFDPGATWTGTYGPLGPTRTAPGGGPFEGTPGGPTGTPPGNVAQATPGPGQQTPPQGPFQPMPMPQLPAPQPPYTGPGQIESGPYQPGIPAVPPQAQPPVQLQPQQPVQLQPQPPQFQPQPAPFQPQPPQIQQQPPPSNVAQATPTPAQQAPPQGPYQPMPLPTQQAPPGGFPAQPPLQPSAPGGGPLEGSPHPVSYPQTQPGLERVPYQGQPAPPQQGFTQPQQPANFQPAPAPAQALEQTTFGPGGDQPDNVPFVQQASMQTQQALVQTQNADLGLPLSPEFEGARRALEDELAASLMAIGVQREQIPMMVKLATERLATQERGDLRQTDNAAISRGLFDSGIRQSDRREVNQGFDRQRQDLAFDAAGQYSDLASQESEARSGYAKSIADLLLQLANQEAQDPRSAAPKGDGEPDGRVTQPKKKKPPKKRRRRKKGNN